MKCLIILFAAALIACNTTDKKPAETLSAEQRDKALNDSANFTSIQWLDTTFLDMGKVKQGQIVEVSYKFKNTGDKNLIIADVKASCGCTVPEKPEKPFAPGEEGVIKAKFDSKGRPLGENRKDVYVLANTKPEANHQLSFRVEITE